MGLYFLHFSFLLLGVLADETILLDSGNTYYDEWESTQNDGDTDLSTNKWYIRSVGDAGLNFYVCRVEGAKQDNFLKTPFIPTRTTDHLYVELEYGLKPCTDANEDVTRDNCQQFFYLHALESNNSKDTTPVDEYNYALANPAHKSIVPGSFDTHVTSIVEVPLTGYSNGIYLAIRDRGACITIYKIVVKYKYCRNSVKKAVTYNETNLAGKDIQVTGQCVLNSTHPKGEPPIKYCRSNGQWDDDFQKSNCFCDKGFELVDNLCRVCQPGYYKRDSGNKLSCIQCPSHSMSLPDHAEKCECVEGYKRADESDPDQGCIAPPEMYAKETFQLSGKTPSSLTFDVPDITPGLTYQVKVAHKVDTDIVNIQSNVRIQPNSIVIKDLDPSQEYIINFAINNGSVVSKPVALIISTQSEEADNQLLIIVIAVCACVVFTIVVTAVLCLSFRGRRCCPGNNRYSGYPEADRMLDGHSKGTFSAHSGGFGSLPNRKMYINPTNYSTPQEAVLTLARPLERQYVSLECTIGGGEFGDVYKANYQPHGYPAKTVAVKTLKPGSTIKEQKDFLIEASIMAQFDDPNVIYLEGVVQTGEPMMIVTEFMMNGGLNNYLKKIDMERTSKQLLAMARGVVSGMKYLSEMNFIHRDLAARNILVDENEVCKVADFGLSRELEEDEVYYRTQGGKIPVRWTAPEAIQHRKFTQKSDVWSFGIVLWEIMSYGDHPYGDWTNQQVLQALKVHYRLAPPEGCPNSVYDIMKRCWTEDRLNRPTFLVLLSEFDKLLLSPLDSLARRDDEGQPDFSLTRSGTLSEPRSMDSQPMLTVSKWLENLNMTKYKSHFQNTGWDTMDKVLLMTAKDLQDIGITLAGHQKKIISAIDYIRGFAPSATFPRVQSDCSGNSIQGGTLPSFPTT